VIVVFITVSGQADERRHDIPFLDPDDKIILLLVGDYQLQRLMLETVGSRYRVTIAYTANEARTLLNAYRYRLVIVTNFGMPPEHAVAIVPSEHPYPVIFISGVWDDELRKACEVKRLRCLKAPFKVDELRQELSRELDKPLGATRPSR
jgi:DNA-binding NtrC family response regulator